MKFTPLSEEQIRETMGLLNPGPAEFEVANAVEGVGQQSKKEHIKLTLTVWDSKGRKGTVFDYLVQSLPGRLLNFCRSIGKPELYENGDLNPYELVGSSGKASLYIQKDKSGQHPDQIKIRDYLSQEQSAAELKDDEFDVKF